MKANLDNCYSLKLQNTICVGGNLENDSSSKKPLSKFDKELTQNGRFGQRI